MDYSGSGWNEGSKLVVGVAGTKIRQLANSFEYGASINLPNGYSDPKMASKGILCIKGPNYNKENVQEEIELLKKGLEKIDVNDFPLIIIVDDSKFTTATLNNWLWVTFTRSNPSHDIYGVGSFVKNKHWGCTGPLIIDARKKEHHAPELIQDKNVTDKIDKFFKSNGPLSKWG
ncbi:MAG: hypothetical protein R2784_05025 [Saprospiraceae bacterium]